MIPIDCKITNLWLDLRKGVFHTHPIIQIWRPITYCSSKIEAWNFHHFFILVSTPCTENCKFIAFTHLKLLIVEVGKFDVCGRPFFANPVTFFLMFVYLLFWKHNNSGLLIFAYRCARKNGWCALQGSIGTPIIVSQYSTLLLQSIQPLQKIRILRLWNVHLKN